MENKKIKKSDFLTAVFLFLSIISAVLFRATKTNWVFINNTLKIESFSLILLFLMVLCSVVLGILSARKVYSKDTSEAKAVSIIKILFLVLSGILFIFSMIYSIGFAISENTEVFILNLNKTISEGFLLFAVPYLAIFYPKLSCKSKKITAVLLVAITLISAINAFFPLAPYKITSTPMVIDNGKEYSIVFSTNDYGTAYAEYSYEGKDYKVYDNTGGRLNSDSKIHSISVPYEHLKNNTYKIGSTRVIEEFSYGSRLGNTVTSDEFTFTVNETDNQTYLVVSDWHTMLDTAYSAIDKLNSNYDAVILLGDASPGVDFEEQVVTNIVQFGGKVSGGTRPILYTRGNHETRGAYAKDLPTALGIDEFYYTSNIGPYSFVVLDSGEDKDDSHSEYGGMTDYNTYRYNMIEWLKNIETPTDKVITLSHAWEISAVEEELSLQGWEELDRLGTRLIISGHEHQCKFLSEKEDKAKEYTEKHPDIVGYIDGGKNGSDYIASLLTLSADGFEIKAVDNNGNEIKNEQFNW